MSDAKSLKKAETTSKKTEATKTEVVKTEVVKAEATNTETKAVDNLVSKAVSEPKSAS